jgi:hypothetical protein
MEYFVDLLRKSAVTQRTGIELSKASRNVPSDLIALQRATFDWRYLRQREMSAERSGVWGRGM